jgi:hypothetical protein
MKLEALGTGTLKNPKLNDTKVTARVIVNKLEERKQTRLTSTDYRLVVHWPLSIA